jgi:hypothetical protein
MDERAERRQGDRRRGERRSAPRSGSDRRQGDRRMATVAAGAAALAAALTFGQASPADAQIYTRKTANGTVEATNMPDGSDFRLAYPGKGTLIHSRAWKLRPSYNGEFNHHINAAAGAHAVSVDLVRAIIQVESGFDYLATSTKGAQGLMQLMPATSRDLGVSNPFDPRQNIFAGVRYLRMMLDTFRGDIGLAAAAYNAGPNAVLRYGGVPPYKETQNYVAKIQSLLGLGQQVLTAAAAPIQALFIVPNDPHAAKVPAAARRPAGSGKVTPARPKIYYKWTDGSGVVHVGQATPPEGVTYSTIRALD